jgi:tripartite-type tricarboxylate transporter receptor subunit TctC
LLAAFATDCFEERTMKKFMLAVLFVCAPIAVPSTPWAQAYPVKPIRLVVPYAPGGATDPIARMVGQMVGDVLGQPFVVENRGGAGGIIGEEMVARAAPDGYTLLIATASTHVAPTFLSKNVPFDPVKDFTPIAAAVEPVLCLVVNTSIPATSVRQLADYGKSNPGKLTYGSAGVGTSNHLHGVLFGQTTGVNVVHVPYKGSGPVITDMISGQIAMAFIPLVAVSQQVRSGKLRLIATLPAKRYPGTPDTPAIGET